jgi:hypothetical protein
MKYMKSKIDSEKCDMAKKGISMKITNSGRPQINGDGTRIM